VTAEPLQKDRTALAVGSANGSGMPIVVIGLGNLLMGDDGIGPRVAQELATRSLPEGVEVIDGGLGGLSVLDWLEGRSHAFIVDAARMGKPPGTIVRFTLEDVTSPEGVSSEDATSVLAWHETSVLSILEFGRHITNLPPIVIYGVEPQEVTPGDRLSPCGQEALTGAVKRILTELENCQGDEHGQSENPYCG